MSCKYRLGLDLGTNSIGWCAVELDGRGDPCGLLAAGVRILTPNEEAGRDPQSKQSLAAGRRAARAMRRRRDRFVRRQKTLMATLVKAGLMPAEKDARKTLEKLDPYWLRAAALNERLEPYEIGRAIFHLNQRRGFRSNRIADSNDSEEGAMKAGMAELRAALKENDAKTLGEYLARRHRRDKFGNRIDAHGRKIGQANANPGPANAEGVRFRPHAEGAKISYDLYPTRDMVERELNAIWAAQASNHAEMTDVLLQQLNRIIIEQRPLKKPLVGRCTFRPEKDIVEIDGIAIDRGERAPRALPLFQRFRILSEIAALEIARPGQSARRLSLQERDALSNMLMTQMSTVSFEKMQRALNVPDDAHFNLERGGRKGLDPDKTAGVLARSGKSESFGKSWRVLSRQRQDEIVEKLLNEADESELVDWLMNECDLTEPQALAASNARLPQGHGHIGRSMLADLVDVMESESRDTADPQTGEIYPRPLTYDEAVEAVGYRHSDLGAGRYARLPYYGTAMERQVISDPGAPEDSQERIGRVPNPTVHIALNQMRLVVNALIDAHGLPADICIELARELKQNRKQKDEATRRNRENEHANERRRAELGTLGYPDTHGNRLLLRLYDELPADERVCVYSGTAISKEMLFSGAIDIDHILPRSKTLDDGFANKVLCTRQSNRFKGNRAPADAWSGDELSAVAARAGRLFPYKAWRFAPDAMEKFAENGDFIARHLTDSQHMARLAKDYLGHLYGEDRHARVLATPGRLTAMLRGKWGLNYLLSGHNLLGEDGDMIKNRDDHRHHAIDAFVIACTDRGLLNKVARAAGRAEDFELDRWAPKGEFPEPFGNYREMLGALLDSIVISHKPDHGLSRGEAASRHVTSGKLHEETAYGAVNEEIGGKRYNLVTRKPLAALTEGEIGRVRDVRLREALEIIAYEAKRDGIKLPEALETYGRTHGIRRVRVLKTERYTNTIRHGDGRFEKTYVPGANHCIEIFADAGGNWHGEGVSVFDANQPGFVPHWRAGRSNACFVMRLQKGDLIEADLGGGRQIYVVRKLSPANNRIEFVSHRFAGKLDASSYQQAAFSKLQSAGARRVRVDPIGRVSLVETAR